MSVIHRAFLAVAIAGAFPVGANAEGITEALASAYLNNPEMAAATYSVRIAAEGVAASLAARRPSISASAGATASGTLAGGTTTGALGGSVGVSYSQRLFDNLKTDAEISAARALADAAAEGLRNAEQNILLSAAIAFLDVLRDTSLTSQRSENMSFLRAQVDSANDRLSIGEGTRIDVSLADAQLAQSVAAYRAAVNSLQASQASYTRWIGHPPSGLTNGFPFAALLPATLEEALQSADQNHPAIRASQAQVQGARHASDAASRAFGPTLDLMGSIGTSFSTSSSSPSTSGSIGLSLSVPLYAGGALGSGARRANLSAIQSELNAQATHNQVRESVIAAWSGLLTATAQIESAESAVAARQIVLNGVIEERNVGQRTTLDVLNARADLTTVQEALIGARYGRYAASFSLLAAIGRLSAADLNLPVTIESAAGYRAAVEDVWRELRELDVD